MDTSILRPNDAEPSKSPHQEPAPTITNPAPAPNANEKPPEAYRIPVNFGFRTEEAPPHNWLKIIIFLVLVSVVTILIYRSTIDRSLNSRNVIPIPELSTSKQTPGLEISVSAPEIATRGSEVTLIVSLASTDKKRECTLNAPNTGDAFETLETPQKFELTPGKTINHTWALTARDRGAWMITASITCQDGARAEFRRALTVKESELRVWLETGDSEMIHVPHSGVFPYTLHIENTSSVPITDAKIEVKGEGARDIQEIKTLAVLRFKKISAHEKITRRFNYLAKPKWRNIRGHVAIFDLEAMVSYRLLNHPQQNISYAIRALPNLLNVFAFARTHDSHGKLITDNSLPLSPGKTSRLWINLGLAREARTHSEVVISAELEPNVHFTGRTWTNNQDQLTIDDQTGIARWRTAPSSFRRRLIEEPLAGFEVEITPVSSDIGTFPAILSSLTADGTPDFIIGAPDAIYGAVSSDLSFDRFERDNGIVRK